MNPPLSPEPDELQAFLLSRQRNASGEVDWNERRQDWLDAIERLYRNITGELLAASIAQRLVEVSRVEKEITEEYLGTYRVQELILKISGETVRFSPKGRNIVGSKGRVDLVGELDTVTLVLEPSGNWSVVVSRTPRQVADLDRATLAESLRRVMR